MTSKQSESLNQTSSSDVGPEQPAMTAQQKRFRSGGLHDYKELLVADRGWLFFLLFEIYNLLLANLPGALGYASRALILPKFLQKCQGGLLLGRGVSLRQPSRVSIGKGVIVDDFAVLDVRSGEQSTSTASISIGDNSFVGRNTIIAAKEGKITLGPASNISSNCRIATQSRVEIGAGSLIAAYVYIGPGNHQRGEAGTAIAEQDMEIRGGVSIGCNVWIGARVTILDGVTIGDNAVIGAHSLVREDVPEGATVAGTPARQIGLSKDS